MVRGQDVVMIDNYNISLFIQNRTFTDSNNNMITTKGSCTSPLGSPIFKQDPIDPCLWNSFED